MYQLQDAVLATPKHACNATHLAYRSKNLSFHLNAQEQCLKYLLHLCLPLLFLPWVLLHKGLGVLGNNWASSVAGCGRMPSYLHYYALYLGGGQFLFISPQMKIHPSNLGGGEHQNKWIISLEHLVLSTNLISTFIFWESNRYHCKQYFVLAAQCGRGKGSKFKAE